MRSLPTHKAAAAAVLLALPLSLAACSSSSKPKTDPATSSSSIPAAESSGTASTGSGSGQTDAKPSKAQVASGMTDYFVGKGVPRSLVNDVTNCVADKGYSQFSDDTLRALQRGKVDKLNPLDAGKLANVTTTCLASGSGASLPSSPG